MSESFFGDLLNTIAERGRRLLGPNARDATTLDGPRGSLGAASELLLSSRGEAARIAVAKGVIDRFQASDEAARGEFFRTLLADFGPDADTLEHAIEDWRRTPTQEAAQALNAASEPRRQELIRRLALAPDGMSGLVEMRRHLLKLTSDDRALKVVDDDFAHLFGSWFNRGFLVLRPIDWSTPANVLEKIIRYEAVHEIRDWDELRRRVAPDDRRCYAFFHPRLPDDPLIFVEVALTKSMPATVAEVLEPGREAIPAREAGAAVFYSISNCQEGLRGVSFGNFLIKQVVEDLAHDLPGIATFVTLSPVPGFSAWLAREAEDALSQALSGDDRKTLALLDDRGWMEDEDKVAALKPVLTRACAWYLVNARNARGSVVDPVARFHLGNGARLERVNFLADRSARAERSAHSMMVNYLYELDDIETNHEAFRSRGEVVTSTSVKRLARRPKTAQPRSDEVEPAR